MYVRGLMMLFPEYIFRAIAQKTVKELINAEQLAF